MKSECVVVSNGGSLFLVGPTGQTYRMTLWERIKMAFTHRYPQRGLNVVYAGGETQSKTPAPTAMLNMFVDHLQCTANPAPFLGDVALHAYMPGARHYDEVLTAAKKGTPDHYIAQAHWHSVNTDDDIAPTPFVFVARSHDPAFQHKTGLDGAYLHDFMKELAIQFAGMCNRCSTAQVRLKDLTIEEPSK